VREALFLMLLSFSGFVHCSRFSGTHHRWIGLAVAFPVGLGHWTIISLVALFCSGGVRYVPFLVSVFALIQFLFLVRRERWAGMLAWLPWGLTAAALGLVAGLSFGKLGWIQVSYDSIEQIAFGRALAEGGWDSSYGFLVATWGMVLPLEQAASVVFGIDVIRGGSGLLAVSLLALLALTIWLLADEARVTAAVLAVVFLASTNFFAFQSAYVHNSLPSATFLLMFLSGLALATKTGDGSWLELSFVGIMGFALCRTEGILFSVAALVLAASVIEKTSLWSRFRRFVTAYVVVMLLWCFVWMSLIGTGSDIMTKERIIIQMAALVFGLGMIVLPWDIFGRIRTNMPEIAVVASLAAILLSYIWQPEHTLKNLQVILGNLLQDGRWGMAWWSVIVAAPLALSLASGRNSRALISFAIVFVSLVVLMGLMRIPYRLGWFDSANRIFTHLLPLLVLGCAVAATSCPNKGDELINDEIRE